MSAVRQWVRYGAIVLVLLTMGALLLVASATPPSMPWDPERPITWDLFRATPPPDAHRQREAAAIHMTIQWRATYTISGSDTSSWVGHVASVTVSNTMEPLLSWVVPGKQSDRLLQHEQTHFDLNEVYRRRVESLLLQIQAVRGSSVEEVRRCLDQRLHAVGESELDRLEAMQARYDHETDHGLNRAEQLRWEEQVAYWLRNPGAAP